METSDRSQRRFSLVGKVATGILVLGVFLAVTVDMSFFLLAGIGAFGPGILRELGVLHDQDEFQRQAAYRAGYHAYLIGGLAAVALVAALQRGTANLDSEVSQYPALVLVALWLSWLFSGLSSYWGAQRMASRILWIFGGFWLVFVLLSHGGEPLVALLEGLIVVPFFLLAWTAGKWPRLAGLLLLACAATLFVVLFGSRLDRLAEPAVLLTLALFLIPLLGAGIALVRMRPQPAVGDA